MIVYIVEYIDDIFEVFEHFKTAYDFSKKHVSIIDSKTKVLKSLDKHKVYMKEVSNDTQIRIFRKNMNREREL